MDLTEAQPRLLVVVGAGGVGKTTLAAAIGLRSAAAGRRTLVMTFDPSLRLKDALGVDRGALDQEIEVPCDTSGRLYASLLDARRTFDRLVRRYAPDDRAAERILGNRYYSHLAGGLGGILEYMAVERLFEVAQDRRYDRIVLDTPPTRQALDFLHAPQRIVSFLDSGALKIALRPWFDDRGHLRGSRFLGPLGRGVEAFFDRVVGLDLLRDMAEFFQSFAPLYDGFRERAKGVEALLVDRGTAFLLVAGPGEERIPDALFFARRLEERGHQLASIVVNRLHPLVPPQPGDGRGRAILSWLGERDRRGMESLRRLLTGGATPVAMPILAAEPTSLRALDALGTLLEQRLRNARSPT